MDSPLLNAYNADLLNYSSLPNVTELNALISIFRKSHNFLIQFCSKQSSPQETMLMQLQSEKQCNEFKRKLESILVSLYMNQKIGYVLKKQTQEFSFKKFNPSIAKLDQLTNFIGIQCQYCFTPTDKRLLYAIEHAKKKDIEYYPNQTQLLYIADLPLQKSEQQIKQKLIQFYLQQELKKQQSISIRSIEQLYKMQQIQFNIVKRTPLQNLTECLKNKKIKPRYMPQKSVSLKKCFKSQYQQLKRDLYVGQINVHLLKDKGRIDFKSILNLKQIYQGIVDISNLNLEVRREYLKLFKQKSRINDVLSSYENNKKIVIKQPQPLNFKNSLLSSIQSIPIKTFLRKNIQHIYAQFTKTDQHFLQVHPIYTEKQSKQKLHFYLNQKIRFFSFLKKDQNLPILFCFSNKYQNEIPKGYFKQVKKFNSVVFQVQSEQLSNEEKNIVQVFRSVVQLYYGLNKQLQRQNMVRLGMRYMLQQINKRIERLQYK